MSGVKAWNGTAWDTVAAVNVTGGASSSPLLYIDSLDLHSEVGDDFNGSSLDAAWTLQGVTSAALSWETTREYDPSVLVVAWPTSSGQVIHRAKPTASDFTLYLTCHGVNATGGMPGLCITDSSGTGIGFSPYNNSPGIYLWNLASWAYSSTGSYVDTGDDRTPFLYGTANVPYVLRLSKVGTSYTGAYSSDGGVNWKSTGSTTKATTMTRVGFGKFFTGTLTQKIGRFNAV